MQYEDPAIPRPNVPQNPVQQVAFDTAIDQLHRIQMFASSRRRCGGMRGRCRALVMSPPRNGIVRCVRLRPMYVIVIWRTPLRYR